jgi:hypothetical protein
MARVAPSERCRRELDDVVAGVDAELDPVERIGRLGARLILQQALEDEVTGFLGRARYERAIDPVSHRNGYWFASDFAPHFAGLISPRLGACRRRRIALPRQLGAEPLRVWRQRFRHRHPRRIALTHDRLQSRSKPDQRSGPDQPQALCRARGADPRPLTRVAGATRHNAERWIKRLMPLAALGVVSREPGDLEAEHDPGFAQADVGDEPLEPLAVRRAGA